MRLLSPRTPPELCSAALAQSPSGRTGVRAAGGRSRLGAISSKQKWHERSYLLWNKLDFFIIFFFLVPCSSFLSKDVSSENRPATPSGGMNQKRGGSRVGWQGLEEVRGKVVSFLWCRNPRALSSAMYLFCKIPVLLLTASLIIAQPPRLIFKGFFFFSFFFLNDSSTVGRNWVEVQRLEVALNRGAG